MRAYGPLRGRDEVLAAAMGVVRRADDRRAGGVVLFSGAAGIGKTAVLSEMCRQAAHMQMRVARGKCDEIGKTVPGAPILGLLRGGRAPLISAADLEQLTHLVGNPLVLVDRAADHLEALATGRRVLIALDDVQWADPLSRYAMRTLIARLADWPVVWVLASRFRPDGMDISAADVVDVEHIPLGPLTSRAIADIARDRLGHGVGDDERELLEAAGGNPFLAVRILEGLAQSTGSARAGLPAEFHAVMRYRLSGLSSTARSLVDALAVACRPVSLAELALVCEVAMGPARDAAVDAAIAAGLVTTTGIELEFVHDLMRQSVYESMAPDVRRRLHTRCAQYFLASGLDAAAAAAHARSAITVGDAANARVMITAAEALATTSAADAAELALHAFSMLRPGQPCWLELGERAVTVLSNAQRANDTIAAADRLLATMDDVEMAGQIEAHAIKALWHNGGFAEMTERTDRALQLVAGRADLAARFRAARALASTRLADADAAVEEADTALALARASGDHDALAFGLQAAGEAAHTQRRHQVALTYFRELRTVSGISYLADEIMQLQLLDRYDHAQLLLDAARADCSSTADALPPSVLFAQAKQHYNLGELAAADQVAASVAELGQLIGTREQVVEATLMRVFIALLRAEPAAAERRLGAAVAVLGETAAARHPGVLFCRGWLDRARGDAEGAVSTWSLLVAQTSQSRNYSAWWPCWLPVIFEGGIACGAIDFMKSVAYIAEEAAVSNPEVATLTGVAANLRGLLMGDLVLVAESVEILRRSPRPVLRAVGTESYGRVLLLAGDRPLGLRHLDDAWDDYDRMGAYARRASVQRVMRQAGVRRAKWTTNPSDVTHRPLSDTERRVVYLIADGHTDKSAARELGVSVNTVGTHIRAAYKKLGVQSRVQLVNALRDRGDLH